MTWVKAGPAARTAYLAALPASHPSAKETDQASRARSRAEIVESWTPRRRAQARALSLDPPFRVGDCCSWRGFGRRDSVWGCGGCWVELVGAGGAS